jgi:hypothetical protein
MAYVTVKQLLRFGFVGQRRQVRVPFIANPATGALEMTFAFRAKAIEALEAEVRGIELSLDLKFALLYLEKFRFQLLGGLQNIRGDLKRQLRYLGCR